MYLVNERKVIRTRNEIMHSCLLNVNDIWKMDAARQKNSYLFETTILKQMIRKKDGKYTTIRQN